jgi:fatty acid kinase
MHQQVEARDAKLAARAPAANGSATHAACGAIAVVSGDGIRELHEGLGFHTLDGGATLNPSTYDLLAGIHAVPAEEVVVLPNSSNVFMAAERAAELSEKTVHALTAGRARRGARVRRLQGRRRQRGSAHRRAGPRAHRRGRARRPR